MPSKKKANIKEIFAANLRENRRKIGLTQEKLADKADISLRYLATLELGGSFPSGDMLEKLADALDIQAYEFFNPLATAEGAMLHLEKSIISNIEKVVGSTIDDRLERTMVFNIENVVKMSVKQAVASELKNFKKK
jgi:transcriptional regulator with XRE-family HTH domain